MLLDGQLIRYAHGARRLKPFTGTGLNVLDDVSSRERERWCAHCKKWLPATRVADDLLWNQFHATEEAHGMPGGWVE